MTKKLEGKTAVITGGTEGIGVEDWEKEEGRRLRMNVNVHDVLR